MNMELKSAEPERLPATASKVRTLKTEAGQVEITCIDGYRILYNNSKKVPFVNLKVERYEPQAYQHDIKGIVDNLKYLNSVSKGMETKDVIELDLNGYKIWGLSRGSIETGSTLGTFCMFPGDDVVVYFYFNNLKPEWRNFETLEDYKKQRDQFLEEYTRHLKQCKSQ